jgi:hypothetical protein
VVGTADPSTLDSCLLLGNDLTTKTEALFDGDRGVRLATKRTRRKAPMPLPPTRDDKAVGVNYATYKCRVWVVLARCFFDRLVNRKSLRVSHYNAAEVVARGDSHRFGIR